MPTRKRKDGLTGSADALPLQSARFEALATNSGTLQKAGGMGRKAMQSPEAPSGFNNTEHNCNRRAQRPRKRNCGKYTFVGSVKGAFFHHRSSCKSYECGGCGPRKIRQVRKRIVQRALQHSLQRFLTLTLDPKKMDQRWTIKEKIAFLFGVWRKMREYLRRKLGKSLVFIAVVELQGNGNPHLHLLVGSYIPKHWISASWQALGGGWATRIEYADVHRVAAYLSHYFTDESLHDLPSGTRRFSTSRGLALFDRTKSEGVWILTRAPIEYWREQASRVTNERYETDKDGQASLVAFVAATVPVFLAARLQNAGSPKLSIEIYSRKKRFETAF